MVEVCHYPDFWWRDHYLPQMPLLFCVSICPEASITLILEKSRRCLCVDAHLILAINWQLLPLTEVSQALPQGRPSVAARMCGYGWLCLCTGRHLSTYMCQEWEVAGNMLFVVGFFFSVWHLYSQRCSSLTLSAIMKLIFKAQRGDKQMWKDARCVISTNRGSIRELRGNTKIYMF